MGPTSSVDGLEERRICRWGVQTPEHPDRSLVNILCYLGSLLNWVCLFMAQHPPMGHGLLIHDVSRSHNDAPQSAGLLCTSDQLIAETST